MSLTVKRRDFTVFGLSVSLFWSRGPGMSEVALRVSGREISVGLLKSGNVGVCLRKVPPPAGAKWDAALFVFGLPMEAPSVHLKPDGGVRMAIGFMAFSLVAVPKPKPTARRIKLARRPSRGTIESPGQLLH